MSKSELLEQALKDHKKLFDHILIKKSLIYSFRRNKENLENLKLLLKII